MSTTTKPSSRWRWIDRDGQETIELQQLRKLRAMGQTPSQLAEAFGLSPDTVRGMFGKYKIRSPRSVLPGEAGSYRAAGPLDQAQPAVEEMEHTSLAVPRREPTTWELWEAFYDAGGDETPEERRERFRQQARAKREQKGD